MTFGGFGGAGVAPGPIQGEFGRALAAQARVGHLPDDIVAAAREERSLRRLRRRLTWWRRVDLIR